MSMSLKKAIMTSSYVLVVNIGCLACYNGGTGSVCE